MQPQSIQQFEDDYRESLRRVAPEENRRCVGIGAWGGTLAPLSEAAQQAYNALTDEPQPVDAIRRTMTSIGRDNVRVALNRLVINGLARQIKKGRFVYWVKA